MRPANKIIPKFPERENYLAQAKVGDEILVQVFLHLPSEVADVECQAKSVDASARKRNSKQLSIALKNGDIIDIVLSIPTININQICKSICRKGRFESVEFAFSIPENCSKESLLSTIVLPKQHIPVAEMSFKIELVSNPSKAYGKSLDTFSEEHLSLTLTKILQRLSLLLIS